jgi:hypothetical protein
MKENVSKNREDEGKRNAIPIQASTDTEFSRRLKITDMMTVGT